MIYVCLQLNGQWEFDNKLSESSKQRAEQEQEQKGEKEEEMIERPRLSDLIFKQQNNKKPTIHSVLYLS